jgi:hypothetical protein
MLHFAQALFGLAPLAAQARELAWTDRPPAEW